MDFKLKGIDKLQSALNERADLSMVRDTIKLNGSELQRGAQRVVPVDTGDLKRSINLSIKYQGLEARVKPSMHYAAYVEFGTRYMAAQPYMRPSFYDQSSKFKSDMQRLMK